VGALIEFLICKRFGISSFVEEHFWQSKKITKSPRLKTLLFLPRAFFLPVCTVEFSQEETR
jgi:hypothetical protein